jgi:CBS domain-containing protein
VLDALELMNSEGVSSLAVVDNQHNVIGNISTADVKVGTSPTRVILVLTEVCFSISQDPALFRC